MFFLFGSVIFGILLRKINQIERSDNRVVFRERPEFIYYDDIPSYRYPRRSIDINFPPQINFSAPPTTAPTNEPDTSGDEALARALQEEYDRESRGESGGGSGGGGGGSGGGIGGGSGGGGGDDWRPLRHRMRGFRDGEIVNIEPYTNYSQSLMGSPF